jgi:hypothetical protein
VTPDVIELVLAQRSQSGWGARKLSIILGQAGVRIAPSTVNKILKEHGGIAAQDPNAASWIRQILVEDDPLSRITTDVLAGLYEGGDRRGKAALFIGRPGKRQ